MKAFLALLILLLPLVGYGKEKKKLSPARELALCVNRVSSYLNVDPLLFLAIYRVESRLHLYAIGVRKGRKPVRSLFPRSKREALRLARRYLRRGYQLDLGIAQINYGNLRTWGKSLEDAFSVCESVKMSAQVLYACMKRYGRTWRAVDCYNKGFHPRVRGSSSYVRKVKREYGRLKRTYLSVEVARGRHTR